MTLREITLTLGGLRDSLRVGTLALRTTRTVLRARTARLPRPRRAAIITAPRGWWTRLPER